MLYFMRLLLFLKKNVLCNVQTNTFFDTMFLLKIHTNLVCLILIMFADDVQ